MLSNKSHDLQYLQLTICETYTYSTCAIQLQLCKNNYCAILMQLIYNYHGNVMLMLLLISPSKFNMWHYGDFWVKIIIF
jgi:hypothetical protein